MTRYAAGANFERKKKKELEDAGYFVIRSAGSKGPVDLVAIKQIPESTFQDGAFVYLVQCKISGRISKSALADLYALGLVYRAVPILATRDGFFTINYELELKNWQVVST